MSYARGYVSSADAGDHGDLPPGARGPPAQRGSVAVVPLYNEDRRGPLGLSPPVAQVVSVNNSHPAIPQAQTVPFQVR